MRRRIVVLTLACLAGACASTVEVGPGGVAVQAPGDDAIARTYEAGEVTIEVRHPRAPHLGIARFELRVSRDAGPVDGLEVLGVADMGDMGHAQAIVATDHGDGRFTLDVPLGMRGEWELELRVSEEGRELGAATVRFTVAGLEP